MAKSKSPFQIAISLSDEAKEALKIALTNGQGWRGKCDVSINPIEDNPSEPSRIDSIREGAAKRKTDKRIADHAQNSFLGDDEKRLRDAWNTSTFISSTAQEESRNNPVTPKQFSNNLPLIRRALKDVGLDEITRLMGAYFDCCLRGNHVWEGNNHGYAHLIGFLARVLKYHKTKAKPYWLDDAKPFIDDRLELTLKIADAFALEFLGRPEYGLENPSADYPKFAKASEWVEGILKIDAWPVDEEGLIGDVVSCLRENYGGGTRAVMPGILKGKGFWSNTFPQFLRAKYD